jgi:hypothetical protein
MKTFNLVSGQEVIVDDDVYEWAKDYRWYKSGTSHVARRLPGGKWQWLSRLIMQPPKGFEVDHIDRNPLNNRRDNLRVVTHSTNQQNRIQSNNTSGYKGVSFRANRGTYRAFIKQHGKQITLGCFLDPEEAARAYDKKAVELFGPDALLNFPPNGTAQGAQREAILAAIGYNPDGTKKDYIKLPGSNVVFE